MILYTEKATRGEFAQRVDGGQYFVTATRDGQTVTFKAWARVGVDGAHTYSETRHFAENGRDREYGLLGTFETDDYSEKLAEFDAAYDLIKLVFAGIKFPLIGRFAWGTIEVRYCTEQAAKQVTGER